MRDFPIFLICFSFNIKIGIALFSWEVAKVRSILPNEYGYSLHSISMSGNKAFVLHGPLSTSVKEVSIPDCKDTFD